MRLNGLPLVSRKRATSSGRSRIAIATTLAPARSSAASCGASATQGTHQLANTLSSLGCPSARSVDGQARTAVGRGVRARTAAPACRSSRCARNRPSAATSWSANSPNSASVIADQRPQDPAQPVHASASVAPRRARTRAALEIARHAPDQREQPAERDQHAAVPDPGHERLPPQPQLPAPAAPASSPTTV